MCTVHRVRRSNLSIAMMFLLGNWQSLVLYIAVFGVSAGLVYFGNKAAFSSKYLKWGVIISGLALPILLAGIRYRVGKDFANYAAMLGRVQEGVPMWPRPIEPLSSMTIHISASTGGAVMMFTLFAVVTTVFMYLALRKLLPADPAHIALGWFMYLCILFPTTLNAVRSGAAVSVAAFALSQLVDTKSKYRLAKFIGWTIVACLFHVSALIVLPIGIAVYLASRGEKLNIKLNLILLSIFTAGAIAFPLFGGLFAIMPIESIRVYERYFMEAGESFYLTKVGLAVAIALAIVLYINIDRSKKDPKLQVTSAIAMYYIPITIVIGWLAYYTGTSRLAFFLEPIIIVVIVYAVQRFWGKRRQNYRFALLAIGCVVALSLVLFVRNSIWADTLPYKTIFSQEARSR